MLESFKIPEMDSGAAVLSNKISSSDLKETISIKIDSVICVSRTFM